MQAYKVKGIIDQSGQLIITEPITIPPGEVEIIVLQAVAMRENSTVSTTETQAEEPKRKVECKTKTFREWLEKNSPTPADFDPDQAKWEYLKGKHNL